MTSEMTLKEAMELIREKGREPLPLFMDDDTDDFRVSPCGQWFDWSTPPEGARSLSGTFADVFTLVSTGGHGDGFYLLRQIEESDRGGGLKGRLVEATYFDYARYSVLYPREAAEKEKEAADLEMPDFPPHVARWLKGRGLTGEQVRKHGLSWEGGRLAIPFVMDDGTPKRKFRRDPASQVGEKYMNEIGGKASLFNKKTLEGSELVIIAEGELDAVRVEQDGITSVSSTVGSNSWKREWSPMFEGKVVVVWYDADEAGREGAAKVASAVAPYAKETWVAKHDAKHGKDITDFLNSTGAELSAETLNSLDGMELVKHKERPRPPRQFSVRSDEKPSMGLVMGHYGVEVFKNNHVVKCIFHEDSTPSMSVSLEKDLFKCFGCDAKGSAYDVVMLMEGCDFKEAKKIISNI